MSFTPFVDALAEEVKSQLTAFAGVEAERLGGIALGSLPVRSPNEPKVWCAELTIRDAGGDFILEIFPATASRDAWFRTTHFACSYRAFAHNDPFSRPATAAWLNAFKARLTAAVPPQALIDGLEAYQPYLAVKDETFRLAMSSSKGVSGVLWLGTRCNQNCHVCWQGRDWPEPPREQFFLWIDELVASKAKSVIISGGEPTLQPYLPELLQHASKAGLHIVLETNGTRLVEPDVRRMLREGGVAEILVSLHSADGQVSDATTRTPGSHALTVAGIQASLADGFVVGLHCVVDKQNHVALDALAKFVVDRFVPVGNLRRVSFSHPTRYADHELHRRMMAPIDEVRPSLAKAVELLHGAGVETSFLGMSGFPFCVIPQPRAALELLPREDVTPESRGDRVYGEVCATCDVRSRCFGVQPGYLDAHGHRGLTAVKLPPGTSLPHSNEERA